MRVAVLGRTKFLLDTVDSLIEAGHEIGLIWTTKAADFYSVTEEDFRKKAQRLNVPFYFGPGINSAEGMQILKSAACDIAVSINYTILLAQQVLNIFPHGILNAHPGDLPRYRGNAAPNWAILNGEKQVALCVHRMSEELDSGPVICKDFLPITHETYITDIYDWLAKAMPAIMVKAVSGIEEGRFVPQPQTGKALRGFPRRPADNGICWNRPMKEVMALIRASSHPFAGAFSFLERKIKIFIWRAEPYDAGFDWLAVPGQVCLCADGDPVIACRDGLLRLREVSADVVDPTFDVKAAILASMRNRLTDAMG